MDRAHGHSLLPFTSSIHLETDAAVREHHEAAKSRIMNFHSRLRYAHTISSQQEQSQVKESNDLPISANLKPSLRKSGIEFSCLLTDAPRINPPVEIAFPVLYSQAHPNMDPQHNFFNYSRPSEGNDSLLPEQDCLRSRQQTAFHLQDATAEFALYPGLQTVVYPELDNWRSDRSNCQDVSGVACQQIGETIPCSANQVEPSTLHIFNEIASLKKSPRTRKTKGCATDGCPKGAAHPTPFCIAHGGGLRCEHAGCKNSRRAPSNVCRSHGGGKRCQQEACVKSAVSGYSFCARHGGGKRCTMIGCNKHAEHPTSRCKGHGGGYRCEIDGCGKSARRPTAFCLAHGGGKRCEIDECMKTAISKARCRVHIQVS